MNPYTSTGSVSTVASSIADSGASLGSMHKFHDDLQSVLDGGMLWERRRGA